MHCATSSHEPRTTIKSRKVQSSAGNKTGFPWSHYRSGYSHNIYAHRKSYRCMACHKAFEDPKESQRCTTCKCCWHHQLSKTRERQAAWLTANPHASCRVVGKKGRLLVCEPSGYIIQGGCQPACLPSKWWICVKWSWQLFAAWLARVEYSGGQSGLLLCERHRQTVHNSSCRWTTVGEGSSVGKCMPPCPLCIHSQGLLGSLLCL